ncbi:FtsX-like permease family protein [Imperialibacter roseus]|uniref:FtsX-like permease family protein n=1 Tax=Imperialibacter roseus TaxID=1324217 RepID=A0ABZ0IVJ9_9BACT|nr:FtsX-like permease family protein [Imperialibacter roseus]WOK08408.1 FtsX-like permease family protein [Imperialibacter roseus]
MLKNHILLAFRHLKKKKGYAASSIVGLALAFAACFFTFSFILHEYSADKHFADIEDTYLLKTNDTIDSPIRFPFIPVANARYMEEHFPEVSMAVPVCREGEETEVTAHGQKFVEKLWVYTEPEVVELFQQGYFDIRSPFEEGTILINETTASRLFGQANPIGQVVTVKEGNYVVAGTFGDFPSNSHLAANILAVPLPTAEMKDSPGLVYMKLQPGTDAYQLALKVDKESESMERFIDVIRYTLVRVDEMYLKGEQETGILRKADLPMLTMMSIVSSVILFISLFNIMNLTQVRTLFRGREMGVKKVLGITASQMLFQFFVEAMMIVVLSALVSFSFIQLSLGDVLAYLHMTDFPTLQVALLLGALLVIVVLSLALMQSVLFRKVMPRDVMAGKFNLGERKWLLRGLVGLQFLIACVLLGGTLVVDKQMNYIRSKPLGFNIDNLWYVPMRSAALDLELMKNKALGIPEIESATATGGLPFLWYGAIVDSREGKMEFVPYAEIDEDYISTLQIQFKQEPDHLQEEGLLVNEQLAAREDIDVEKLMGKKIIGQVSDYHFNGLNATINPMMLVVTKPKAGYLALRVREGRSEVVEQKLKAEWEALYPGRQFEFHALYDDYLAKHREANELNVVLKSLSLVAVFISCIGLASLTGFFVKKRFKEIAIRKVLGATTQQLLREVNKSYVFWILGACTISAAIIRYFGSDWLAEFAYSTSMDLWLMAGPAVAMLLVSSSIMVLQTWKTARTNPVEALRAE